MSLSAAALTLIGWYGREVSPHKGYRCAHARHFGGPSCSAVVASIVAARGVPGGWREIRAQFAACGVAAELIARRKRSGGSGRCSGCGDSSCDACDVADLACPWVGTRGGLHRALLAAVLRRAWEAGRLNRAA